MVTSEDYAAARAWLGLIQTRDPELIEAAAAFHASAREVERRRWRAFVEREFGMNWYGTAIMDAMRVAE